MGECIRRLTGEERGAAVVVFALILTVLAGCGALVLDLGQIVLVRQQLHSVADAAVLSGAKLLPEEPAAAEAVARAVAAANGVGPDQISVNLENDNRRLAVTVDGMVDFGFARVFGLTQQSVTVGAAAAVGAITAMRNVVPLGIQKEEFVYGETYTIKVTPHTDDEPLHGNYRAIALGGFGGSIYEDNLKYGYQGVLGLGTVVTTEPGNMSGPTKKGLEYRLEQDPEADFATVTTRSPRLVFVPIIDSFNVSGRSEVRVVGFAAFFLEDAKSGEITGKFCHYVAEGEIDQEDTGSGYGLKSVRLVR